jgi:hypothetical protein
MCEWVIVTATTVLLTILAYQGLPMYSDASRMGYASTSTASWER